MINIHQFLNFLLLLWAFCFHFYTILYYEEQAFLKKCLSIRSFINACEHAVQATVVCGGQRNTLLETFLFFNHIGPRDWTQIINLGDKAPLPAEPYHQPKTPTQFQKMSLTTPLQTHIILLLKFSIIHSHSFLLHKRPGYIKLDSLKFLVSHNYWNWHILQYRLAWHVLMIYQQNTRTPATHLPPCQR